MTLFNPNLGIVNQSGAIIIDQQDVLHASFSGDYVFLLISKKKNLEKLTYSSSFSNPNLEKPSSPRAAKGNKNTSASKAFLDKISGAVLDRLEDNSFSIHEICKQFHLSYMQLYRKIKAQSGKTPIQFIRSIRLEKGRKLLSDSDLSVSEIAYAVGFNDPNYFSRTFHKEFGKVPSDYK